ncbi:MAG: DUF411 domain-containing protein [Curvibacter sp.]|nr:MAG: DUF411 domain-containing protein [Curvibacter sp.]
MSVHLQHRRLLLAAGLTALSMPLWANKVRTTIQVWKDPNCGCCKDWVVHLEQAGFRVTVQDTGNAEARKRLGISEALGSCHTAEVAGYAIEGHVPAKEIQRLLRERPLALGIAVPGMPVGSPGMDGPIYQGRKDPYDVVLIAKNGSTSIFQSYR